MSSDSMGRQARLGILGGSGLYAIEGLDDVERVAIDTPFGEASDELVVGRLEGTEVAFLARHGHGHRLMPTEINYRANIYAMKSLGVEFLVSASAVGSLVAEAAPLDVVVPDQFIDRTRHRCDSFFGEGIVAHVSLADPFCAPLASVVAEAVAEAGARVHRGGTYLCMEGPQFSTRAESELYRSWGATVIGMTNLQEARLAREAELCYATMAFVTDYDCWKKDEEPVTVEAVIERLGKNAERAKQAVRTIAAHLPEERPCACATALDNAVITAPGCRPRETEKRLELLLARSQGRAG